jgi:glycosyltransferase involved in cell wall biosynthesis
VDLFHSPDFTLPPVRGGTRTIVTVHDLSFLHVPSCFEPPLLDYLRTNVPQAVHRADWVLADSENTRRDVIELLGVPAEKVSVIYPGVEPRFRPGYDRQTLDRVRAKYGLPSRFILSVGTVQPRKNYARLIEAFARLEEPDLRLVIVGGLGWLYEDIFAAIRSMGLEDRVTVTGYVEDVDLPAVYNLAEVFALPSLYEGFGIPPLEAMACGLPVIVADNSSLPEVVGDAGVLVNAYDTASLAEGLTRLLGDPALRQRLSQRGRARAQTFTWRQAAQSLLTTYRQVHAM